MTLNVHLLVDPRGWPTALDPELLNALIQARLRMPIDIQARELGTAWSAMLPRQQAIVFAFLTSPLVPGWRDALRSWLTGGRAFYALYIDSIGAGDLREMASMTAIQAIARAPYRIVQQNGAGLERAASWIAELLAKFLEAEPAVPPPVRVTATRWRHLPSNQHDTFAYPDQVTLAIHGAAGYRMAGASVRGKSHAHQGTFRDDAFAFAATPHWNILAVADGAGTAPLARLGSNLAVSAAITAIRDSAPSAPAIEDMGRAIYTGLRAAYTRVRDAATEHNVPLSDLHTTLQVVVHWPQPEGCLIGLAQVGDGIIVAETVDGAFYPPLAEPDTDPEDSGRTLFLTGGPLRQWMERTKIYQFDSHLAILAMMTDGVAGDLEPYVERLPGELFDRLRQRVLFYPLRQREHALLSFISYDRRGSFDDRTLVVLSKD